MTTTNIKDFMVVDWGNPETSYMSGIVVDGQINIDLEIMDKIINGGIPDYLQGFEKVLGRKFTCQQDCADRDCKWKNRIFMNGYNICGDFILSDDTKAAIKLKDYEEIKIDTHPKYFIANLLTDNLELICKLELIL